ncbi:MAG: hypothetical protein GTN97_02275 [Nitrosopumilaceae archaeon]|nr:hypothetical protein [Nitrosopumilaceae archaeon]NIP09979.1 hypothetical protein [Nitrosopumilaceae archaeon]NIS94750.1 hypothetical protein [Nitrosopumilaceae archaeon]
MSFSEISHEYLESLNHTHILLFHEDQKNAEKIEFNFIKSGLDKNQRCFYTTNEPESLKERLEEFGIPVDNKIENNLLNIIPIPKTFDEYSKMIEEKVASLPKNEPIRVVSTHYFDFNSDKKTESMEKIEQWVDDNFEKIPGNFICSFHVPSVSKDLAGNFMKNLLDSHHSVLVLTKDDKVEKFDFP